ncbi:hypothetical protein T08_1840, partial [Trichinella sp. T8]
LPPCQRGSLPTRDFRPAHRLALRRSEGTPRGASSYQESL